MPHNRSMSNDVNLAAVAKPLNQTAVAIDNDKQSPYAVRYAIEHLTATSSSIILIHVKVPKSDSQTSGDGSSTLTDADIYQLFTRFRAYCARKRITVTDVLLHDADIAKALLEYINEHAITNIVLGASTRTNTLLARKSRNSNVPSAVMKAVPDFCSVYVISKGKLHEKRLATRTLANHAAPPKVLSSSSDVEDGDRAMPLRGDQRCVSEKIRPKKSPAAMSMDNIELPSRTGRSASASNHVLPGEDHDFPVPTTFRSMDVTGHNLDFGVPTEPNESKSPKFSSPQDIEEEMRRLKLELKQTMSMYNAACKEAISAKKQASELHQYQMEEARRFEQARLAEEAAREIVEMEKAKCRAAMEAAEKAKRLAEMEAQRRQFAEMKAKREAEEKNRALSVLSNNHARYRKYTIEEIEEATNRFDASLRIGEGGYGPVFRGKLDHTPVAIKVLRPDAAQGKKQFQQEVEVLSRMRHPNLVLLLGACPEYGCLVYEFMNYGSLEDRLLRKGNTPSLPWEIRFRIASDIATGLLFLHQSKPEPLVHRDLKPGNILLDRNYVCKIADIGLARLVPPSVADSVTQYHMTSAAGTFCYIDPEYQQTGMLGVKSDIYSLGVMLLQIITARPPMGLTHHVERSISKGTFADFLDPTVPDWPVEEALSFAKLALKCAELRKKDRPDLGSHILPELNRLSEFAMNKKSNQESLYGPGSHSRTPSPRQRSPYRSQEGGRIPNNIPRSSGASY